MKIKHYIFVAKKRIEAHKVENIYADRELKIHRK
jgi:hypothetical protein